MLNVTRYMFIPRIIIVLFTDFDKERVETKATSIFENKKES